MELRGLRARHEAQAVAKRGANSAAGTNRRGAVRWRRPGGMGPLQQDSAAHVVRGGRRTPRVRPRGSQCCSRTRARLARRPYSRWTGRGLECAGWRSALDHRATRARRGNPARERGTESSPAHLHRRFRWAERCSVGIRPERQGRAVRSIFWLQPRMKRSRCK
jgi:hypothetical protein